MKRMIALVAAMVIFSMAASAMAATNTLTVSANVVGTCKFDSATSTLGFGGLDPLATTDVTASSSTTFWCTKGTAYSIADDDGQYETGIDAPRMRHTTDTTEFIPYSLSYSPSSGTGVGKTTTVTLTIDGTITNANYVNAAAGDYSDTVVITITP